MLRITFSTIYACVLTQQLHQGAIWCKYQLLIRGLSRRTSAIVVDNIAYVSLHAIEWQPSESNFAVIFSHNQ